MRTRVQKWANSIALRIPRAFAEEMQITADSAVEVRLDEGGLVVIPISAPRYSLDALLAGITEENLHEEVDWGESIGSEAW